MVSEKLIKEKRIQKNSIWELIKLIKEKRIQELCSDLSDIKEKRNQERHWETDISEFKNRILSEKLISKKREFKKI